jgi:hypothetical protein
MSMQPAETCYWCKMAAVIFLCPNMGVPVQGWFADDGAENGSKTYEGVMCLACRRVHMVNPRTGKILGES